MANNLFVGHIIRDQEVLRELDHSWERVLEIMPERATDLRRKQPHVTIAFLGAVSPKARSQRAALLALIRDLERIAGETRPIKAKLHRIGTFEGAVWAGLQPPRFAAIRLRTLRRQIGEAVNEARAKQGLEAQELSERFRPHITLGRFDPEDTAAVNARVDGLRLRANPELTIDCYELLMSGYGHAEAPQYRCLRPPFTLTGNEYSPEEIDRYGPPGLGQRDKPAGTDGGG